MNTDLYEHICDETRFLQSVLSLLNDAHDALKFEPVYLKIAQHRIALAREDIKKRLKTRAET